MGEILLIEPFYGGSHRNLIDTMSHNLGDRCVVSTLTAKKWHWRARTSALYLSQSIPHSQSYRVLFTSSVLNMAELIALRPDLASLRKILYFHENQLVYPVRKQNDRDFQFGYNQILSSLVADVVLFNSTYNMTSFLSSISSYLKLIPDNRPRGLSEQISPKCRVLYFPVNFPLLNPSTDYKNCDINHFTVESKNIPKDKHLKLSTLSECDVNLKDTSLMHCSGDKNESQINVHDDDDKLSCLPPDEICSVDDTRPLHIVWPHRWEHDKNPESFFQCLNTLSDEGQEFHVSVLGETFTDVPKIFEESRTKLSRHIKTWGYQINKEDYYTILCQADVVVSTAHHEFFGVAMLEAVHCGCYPLCPNRLVYPEIFPEDHLYNTDQQLVKRLRHFCKRPNILRKQSVHIDCSPYSWESLRDSYLQLFTDE